MGRVTIITDDGNTEKVTTSYVGIYSGGGRQKKVKFKLKSKMPNCVKVNPSKAATSWDVVATVNDETYSGAITKVTGKQIYFDPNISNLSSGQTQQTAQSGPRRPMNQFP